MHPTCRNVDGKHVVFAHVQRLLHHVVQVFRLSHSLLYPGADQARHQHNDDYGDDCTSQHDEGIG